MARPKKQNNINLKDNTNHEVDEMSNVVTENEAEVLESLEGEMDRVRIELQRTKLELEAKREELKNLPRRDISEQERAISEKQVANISKNESLKSKIEDQKKRDNEMVTGIFSNLRAPGQAAKLTYHKYADDPVKWYNFEHGQTYTIKRGFADQINGKEQNNPCYYTPRFIEKTAEQMPHSDNVGENSTIHSVDTSQRRYMFSPINF